MKNVSLRQYKIGRNLDIDETGDLVITGPKQCFGWVITNLDATTIYFKLYDKATAPVVGTDTPILTIPIATGAISAIEIMGGIDFALGIGVGATTGIADNDVTGPGTNEVAGQILYK